MLSGQHYYHRIIRKLVVAFGSIFNNMRLVRYDSSTNPATEIERINVPLMYSSKEKFYMRIANSPDLLNPVNLTLPRMAFEMNGISYDPLRKISNFADQFAEGAPVGLKKVRMTPYNFDFNLYAFVRNTEDGAQIIEQILPYFTPDYTVTLDFVGIEDFKMDVPIVFNSISYDDSHEGDPEATRSIVWTLNFTAKGYLFGPIANVSIVRKATSNIYDSTFETNALQELTVGSVVDTANAANTPLKVGELVYQGSTLDRATATGYVHSWTYSTNTSSKLVLSGVKGTFDTNANLTVNNTSTLITGAVTGSRWYALNKQLDPNQLVNITVEPIPSTANSEAEAFGFSTTITEYF
jgi:hypothetical protein